MEIVNFKDFINNNKYSDYKLNLAIGEFDGVHQAHKALLDKAIGLTNHDNQELSSCITFEPHPYFVFNDNTKSYLLTSLDEKLKRFEKIGIDLCIIIDFNIDFSNITWEEFIKQYLLKLPIKNLICGEDFSFGKNGLGKPSNLIDVKEFNTEVLYLQKLNDEVISSSRIRKCLLNGDIKQANELLGFNYKLKGLVIHGMHVGTSLGFPTANLKIDSKLLIPKPGVYACLVNVFNKQYLGILNIGHNPTCNLQTELSIEVNIINFNENIYDQEIEITFIDFIRNEIKFNSKDELINQLNTDKNFVLNNFKNIEITK